MRSPRGTDVKRLTNELTFSQTAKTQTIEGIAFVTLSAVLTTSHGIQIKVDLGTHSLSYQQDKVPAKSIQIYQRSASKNGHTKNIYITLNL